MSELRMHAYYYGFSSTGSPEIDLILSAVACAGKAYHHTQDWQEDCEPYEGHVGQSCADWIQCAAKKAAAALAASQREREQLQARVDAAEKLLRALRGCDLGDDDPLYCRECNECDCHKKDAAANEADAPRGQAVARDGWQLVPKEPTQEMVMAASEVTNRGESLFFTDRYKAMLAVAPPPSPVGEADGVRDKYRPLNDHDVSKVIFWIRDNGGEIEDAPTLRETLQSIIGAVVPQEPK